MKSLFSAIVIPSFCNTSSAVTGRFSCYCARFRINRPQIQTQKTKRWDSGVVVISVTAEHKCSGLVPASLLGPLNLHFLQVLWSKDKEHKGLTKAAYAKGLACYCALFKKHILIGGLFTTFLATVSCKVVVVLQQLPSYSSH